MQGGGGKGGGFVYLKHPQDSGCLQPSLPSKESLHSPALVCIFLRVRDAVSILEQGWGGGGDALLLPGQEKEYAQLRNLSEVRRG